MGGQALAASDAGVYQILNKVNRHQYIGSAIHLRKRWAEHQRTLRCGEHPNAYLQNAWNLYGSEAFVCLVLEYVPSPERLIEREQNYLDTLQPEYNLAPTAGSQFGYRHTDTSKQKMSAICMGRVVSKETKQKISMTTTGKVVSEETKKRISEALTGREFSVGWRRKLSNAHRGKSLSEEQRRKLSRAGTGRKHSETARQKISEAKRGERNPCAKLSGQEVCEIKAFLERSVLSQREIGVLYGVCRTTIASIKTGNTWTCIPTETASE